MAKRRREEDSDDMNEHRTVFVDTSLDTHLALILSDSDTVTDFKEKIVLEHMQCFPEIGNIQIHSLKVKRRGKFYHLPDIMLIWSAFLGVKKNWFLSADASGTPACCLNQSTSELGTSNGEKMDITTVNDDGLSSDMKTIHTLAKTIHTLAMSLPTGVTEKSVVTGGLTIDKSFEKTTDFHRIDYSYENVAEIEPRPKKKRKVSHKEDISHNTNLKDNNASVHALSQDISKPKTSGADAMKEGQVGIIRNEHQGKPTVPEISDVRNDKCNNRDRVVFEGTSVPAPEEKSNLETIGNAQKLIGTDKTKDDGSLESMVPENITASKPESELGQNVVTDHQGGDAVEVPNISAMMMDASDATGDVNSDGKKRKKKKTKKTPGRIQDTSDMEQIIKGDVKVFTETHKSEEQEGENEVLLNHDHELIIDANVAMGPEMSSGTKKKKKKKKKEKKSSQISLEKSGVEQADNGITGASGLLLSTDHIPEETDKTSSVDAMNEGQVGMVAMNEGQVGMVAMNEGQVGMVQIEQQGKPTVPEISDVRNDKCNNRDRVVFEGTSVPAPEEKSDLETIGNAQKLIGSDKTKDDGSLESMIPENITASKPESELGQNVANDHQGGDAVKVPNISAMIMDASDATGDVNSDGKKRKKKTKKTLGRIQDTSDMEQIIKGDVKVFTETHKSEEQEGEKEVHLNHDHELIIDANVVMGPEMSIGTTKKKKKEKKSSQIGLEKSGMEQQADKGVTGASGLLQSTDHIPEETDKRQSNLNHNGNHVHMKLLDSSSADACDKVQDANENVADFVELTQNEQTVKDIVTSKEKMRKKTKSTAGSHQVDFPAMEKDNQIVELNQEGKNSGNMENKDKKAKRKSKKNKPTASDILEKLPITDQNLGLEGLTTEENLSSLVKSEQEHKSKEKLEERNLTSLNNDDLAKPFENKGDGINFKHYFLAGQDQDKAGSRKKVKKATKSNAEMKTRKNVKDTGLPSVSISTESQSSVKPFENQESESKSRVMKASGRQNGESEQNSDQGEVNPNSIKGSNAVKDSNPSDKILAENRSLDKSSSGRSETLFKSGGNKRSLWSFNVTNNMVMKTPLKRSLLSKAGALFEDNSGESSSDENGNLHFDASIHTPADSSSDSSSVSGDSVGGSDFSQDSTRCGSNDAKGRSAGSKSMSKLDISASKDLTMDMILRSSKRFKKAKLKVAKNELELNESQALEFVPDSLPNP